MARSQQFADGYRRASRDAVEWLHRKADKMADPRAQAILNSAASGLGNAALRATPDVTQKEG